MAEPTDSKTSTAGAGAAPPAATTTPPATAAGESTLLGAPPAKAGTTDKGATGSTQAQKDGASSTDAAKTEGAVDAKAGEAAPAEVDVKLPGGVEADAELLSGFKAWAKESGLKSENAQKVVDLFVKSQQAQAQKAETAMKQQRTQVQQQWMESIQSDKELGGNAFEATKLNLTKAVNHFFAPSVRELFNKTGLGNHPDLVRGFARIGKALSEDSIAGTSDGPTAEQSEDALIKSLYPNTPAFHK
jgi:hypothetical protein